MAKILSETVQCNTPYQLKTVQQCDVSKIKIVVI